MFYRKKYGRRSVCADKSNDKNDHRVPVIFDEHRE